MRGEDDVADACVRPVCSTPPSDHAPCASDQWAGTDCSPSAPRTCLNWQDNRVDLRQPASTRPSSGRGPPASRDATGSNGDRRKSRPRDTFDHPQANGHVVFPEVGGTNGAPPDSRSLSSLRAASASPASAPFPVRSSRSFAPTRSRHGPNDRRRRRGRFLAKDRSRCQALDDAGSAGNETGSDLRRF